MLNQGSVSILRGSITSTVITIIKIRRSHDRHLYNGIPYTWKDHAYIETEPSSQTHICVTRFQVQGVYHIQPLFRNIFIKVSDISDANCLKALGDRVLWYKVYNLYEMETRSWVPANVSGSILLAPEICYDILCRIVTRVYTRYYYKSYYSQQKIWKRPRINEIG